jgi:hypothetical protein
MFGERLLGRLKVRIDAVSEAEASAPGRKQKSDEPPALAG